MIMPPATELRLLYVEPILCLISTYLCEQGMLAFSITTNTRRYYSCRCQYSAILLEESEKYVVYKFMQKI